MGETADVKRRLEVEEEVEEEEEEPRFLCGFNVLCPLGADVCASCFVLPSQAAAGMSGERSSQLMEPTSLGDTSTPKRGSVMTESTTVDAPSVLYVRGWLNGSPVGSRPSSFFPGDVPTLLPLIAIPRPSLAILLHSNPAARGHESVCVRGVEVMLRVFWSWEFAAHACMSCGDVAE